MCKRSIHPIMKKRKITFDLLICFMLLTLFHSCKEPIEQYLDQLDCHENKGYDAESFKADLIGLWQWTEMDCENSSISTNYAGLALEFTEAELIVIEDGVETARTTYEIDEKGNGEFWILDAGDFPVTGRANFICDDELVMEGSLELSCIALYSR